jgi:UDP-glucose 4-epimerase
MTPQTWLITGGAGYIGAHIADLFLDNNKEVVIYDSLYQGLESRIGCLRKKYGKEIPLIVGDIRDAAVMTADIHLITKEMRFCALNEPLESLVREPRNEI